MFCYSNVCFVYLSIESESTQNPFHYCLLVFMFSVLQLLSYCVLVTACFVVFFFFN